MNVSYYQIFKDKKGHWRWRFVAENGKIVGTSGGDGYERKIDCYSAIRLMQDSSRALVKVQKENTR